MNFRKIFSKTPSPEETTSLDRFQKEIEEIKEEEIETGKAMLASVNRVPEVETLKLTEEDMGIWNKLKEGELELDELEEYRGNIDPNDYHRRAFSNFVIKKLLSENKDNEIIRKA